MVIVLSFGKFALYRKCLSIGLVLTLLPFMQSFAALVPACQANPQDSGTQKESLKADLYCKQLDKAISSGLPLAFAESAFSFRSSRKRWNNSAKEESADTSLLNSYKAKADDFEKSSNHFQASAYYMLASFEAAKADDYDQANKFSKDAFAHMSTLSLKQKEILSWFGLEAYKVYYLPKKSAEFQTDFLVQCLQMQKKIPVSKRNLDGKILEELVRMAKIQKKEVDALNYQESLVLVTKGTKQASSKQMDSNAGLIKAKLELAQMFIQCNDFKQAGKATQQIVSLLRKPIKEERNVYLYSRAFGLASRLHDSKMERQLLANLLSGSKAILKALPSSDPEQNRRAAAYAQALLAVAKLAESANPRTQNSTDSLSGQMRKMVEDGVLILVQTDPRGGRLSSAVNQFKRVNNLLSQSQKDCLESELKQYVSAADLDDKQKYRNSPLVAILADLNNANNKTDDTCASSADSAKSNALSKIFSGNNLGKEPSCTDLRSAISGHGGAGSNQPDRKQVKAYQDLLEKTRGLFEQGKYAEVKANAEKLVAMALSLYSRFSNEYMSMTVEAAYWSLIAGDFASGDHYLYDLKTGGQKSALTFVISPSRFAIRAMMIQAIALAADGDLKRAQAYLICALRLSPVSGTSSQVASGSNGADFLKMLGTQIKTNAGNNSGAQDWTSCLGDTNLSESDKKALEGIATQVLGFIGQLGEMISKEVEGQSASSAVTGQALEASVDGQIVSYIRQSLENTGAYELEEEALNFWIKDLEEKQSTQDLLAGVRQWLCLVYLKQANSLRKTGDMTNSQAAFAKAKVLHDQIVATKSPSTAKTFSFLKDFNGDYAKLVDQFSSSTSKKRERCPG